MLDTTSDAAQAAETDLFNASAVERENWWERWGRRAISIPIYFLLFFVVVALLPALVPIVFVIDAVRRDNWSGLRALGFLVMYLAAEITGVHMLFFAWVISGAWFGAKSARFMRMNFWVQRMWASWLWEVGSRLYAIRLEVENAAVATPGPIMVFIRHAAMVDTILPAQLFIVPHKLRLRYVMKRSLLWDPCLDIGGNRLPNYFVRRASKDPARETNAIKRLLQKMPDDGGVMIYPEGTRFSKKKREQVLQRLRKKGDEIGLRSAAALKNVLPARLGGMLAILEANHKMDAVFVAHVGFEIANRAYNLINGALVGRKILVRYWRVPFKDIPTEREAQIEWILDWWRKIDQWVGEQLARPEFSQDQPEPEFSAPAAASGG